MSCFLELESDVEEKVERIGVVVLRVARELVGFSFALGVSSAVFFVIVVRSILFVSSGAELRVVGDILQREVDIQAAAVAQTEIASDAEIEHESALELLLFGSISGHFFAGGIEEHTAFTLHFVFGHVVGRTTVGVCARGSVEVSIAVVRAVESTVGREPT